jgi:hypothetical protein
MDQNKSNGGICGNRDEHSNFIEIRNLLVQEKHCTMKAVPQLFSLTVHRALHK